MRALATSLLFVLLLSPGSSGAADKCLEQIPDEVWKEREEAVNTAISAALATKSWERVPVVRLSEVPTPGDVLVRSNPQALADGGTEPERVPLTEPLIRLGVRRGDRIEHASTDAGEPSRSTLVLGTFREGDEDRFVYARSANGNVFWVHVELTGKPKRIVRSCDCPPGTGGAERPPLLLGAEVTGVTPRLANPAALRAKLRTVEIRYSRARKCFEP